MKKALDSLPIKGRRLMSSRPMTFGFTDHELVRRELLALSFALSSKQATLPAVRNLGSYARYL